MLVNIVIGQEKNLKNDHLTITGCYSDTRSKGIEGRHPDGSTFQLLAGYGRIKIYTKENEYRGAVEELTSNGVMNWAPILIDNLSIDDKTGSFKFDLPWRKYDKASNTEKERIFTGVSGRISSKGLLINWGQYSNLTGRSETLFRRVKIDCMQNVK